MCRFKKQIPFILSLLLLLQLFMSGCGNSREVLSDATSSAPSASVTTESPETASPAPTAEETAALVALPLSEDIAFSLSSGAGNWSTEVTLHPNGSFTGHYQDVNLGETGEGYGHTVYICDFEGQFGNITKISDHVYSMQILSIQQREPTGKEELKEDYDSFMEESFVNRYVYSDPYGFTPSYAVFELYLPGTPIENLSSDYTQWAFYGSSPKESTLPFYGLYNTLESLGFRS